MRAVHGEYCWCYARQALSRSAAIKRALQGCRHGAQELSVSRPVSAHARAQRGEVDRSRKALEDATKSLARLTERHLTWLYNGACARDDGG